MTTRNRTAPTSADAGLIATRESLHRVAEHVLAAAQQAETGRIRLRAVPGGFETWDRVRGERIQVIDGQLVVAAEDGSRTAPLTTVREAAQFAGTTAGLPPQVYTPATPFQPDAPLEIDDAAARTLAEFWSFTDAALRRFADRQGTAVEPVLWPEHLDVGITIDAVNYGGSPGDAAIPLPYLYIGPHDGPPTRDDFWNTDFGAAKTATELPSLDAAVEFFERGGSRLSQVAPGQD